jgi:hypothetical protein
VRTFSREEDQLEFGDKLTENATLSVPPRFHTTKDLDNDAFRENDSYKAFEGMLEKLKTHLFPQGVKPATQKGQAAAIAMGIINAPSEEPSNS